jgi:hypothetical protein
MTAALLGIGAVAFILFIVALSLATARLRSRFISWIFGRVTRSINWMARPGALNDDTGEGMANELSRVFGPVDRPESEPATRPKRAGAAPVKAGTAIENLEERDRK